MPNSATSEHRLLLDRYLELRRNLAYPLREKFSTERRREMAQERDRLMTEYAERLPFVRLSRCPFCQSELEYPLDPTGLDGPWWHKGDLADYPRPNGCEHFRVLLGAINFKDLKPTESEWNGEVEPGPGAPYVVPRLLDELKMRAVISSFTMPKGYVCYPIAYFSEEPVHGALLHQPWGRQAYRVFNEAGESEGWWSANDVIDFDIESRVAAGSVLWIQAGDESLKLHGESPCPYANLPGVRAPQRIVKGELRTLPLPTGETFKPFE